MAAKKKPTARKTTTKRKPRSKTGSPRPSAPKIRIANLREGNSASPLLTKFCASMVMPYRIQSDLRGSWQGPLIEKRRAIIICDGLVRRILPIALNSEQHMAAARRGNSARPAAARTGSTGRANGAGSALITCANSTRGMIGSPA